MRSTEYLQSLVRELAKLSDEVEWVEFKCNNKDPERIAKYISGLSNSAERNDRRWCEENHIEFSGNCYS